MTIKVAINGLDVLGDLFSGKHRKYEEIEIVAVNDLTDAPMLAHLIKYDSVHGIFDAEVGSEDDHLVVNGKKIKVYAEKDPSAIAMGRFGYRYRH